MSERSVVVSWGQVHPGSGYSDDEVAFIKAMDRYKRTRRRPYPTCAEVLAVLESLGWRRVAEPEAELPRPVFGDEPGAREVREPWEKAEREERRARPRGAR